MSRPDIFLCRMKLEKYCVSRSVFWVGLLLLQIQCPCLSYGADATRDPKSLVPLREQHKTHLENQKKNFEDIQKRRKDWENELDAANNQLAAENAKPQEQRNETAITNLKDRIQKATDALEKKDPNPPEGYKDTRGLKAEEKKLAEQIKQSQNTVQELDKLAKGVQDSEQSLNDYQLNGEKNSEGHDVVNLSKRESLKENLEQAKIAQGQELNKIDSNGNGIHDAVDTSKPFSGSQEGKVVTNPDPMAGKFENASAWETNYKLEKDSSGVSRLKELSESGTNYKFDGYNPEGTLAKYKSSNDEVMTVPVTPDGQGGYVFDKNSSVGRGVNYNDAVTNLQSFGWSAPKSISAVRAPVASSSTGTASSTVVPNSATAASNLRFSNQRIGLFQGIFGWLFRSRR